MKRKTLPTVLAVFLALFALAISSVCQADPAIINVDPSSANRGQTLDVKIRGLETHFDAGISVATFTGSGIIVNSTDVVDATHVIANITIGPDAENTARDVNVITGVETPAVLMNGFTVELPAPTVTSIEPGLGANTGIVEIIDLAGSNFRDSATVKLQKSGEADIPGSDVDVVSEDKITCTFDLTNADDGYWDVVVTNDDNQTGTLGDGFQVLDSPPAPGISLIKSGPDFATAGDQITYTFAVKNTGNDILTGVIVTDSLLWSGAQQIGQLDPNATSTFEKTYTIPDSATVSVENSATARGTDPAGTTVTDTNDHAVALETGLITLLKQGPGSAKAGETVTYTFIVYNNSQEDFTDVRVTDPLFGDDWSHDVGDLASSDQTSFDQDYTIPDSQAIPFTNTATVTATDAYGLQISDTASYTTVAPSPPGSCTASTLVPSTVLPDVLWALLVFVPLGLIGALRWRRRALTY